MSSKVSICIPTYNRKNYLKETLASTFTQTYKDFDVEEDITRYHSNGFEKCFRLSLQIIPTEPASGNELKFISMVADCVNTAKKWLAIMPLQEIGCCLKSSRRLCLFRLAASLFSW